MFKTYKAEVENQLEKKIKILRSDRGREYESNDFAEFLQLMALYIKLPLLTLHSKMEWPSGRIEH